MKAAIYEAFGGPLTIESCRDPAPAPHGAVLQVSATGICRSDWHGWMGHDPDITLPHVPGHEISGVIAAVGKHVIKWRPGARVTLPFVCGCGSCEACRSGQHQVCERQTQPGFTHWGSYAEFVAIDHADVNLVGLDDDIDAVTAASLGCRFATAFRAVVLQGRVRPGEWVAVHGCGGVGLSAVMIAAAFGAQVVAVDIDASRLALSRELGAQAVIDAGEVPDVVAAVRELSGGGVHLSLDALGSPATCGNSLSSLRKRGRHVQVGLMVGTDRAQVVPMDRVVADELEVLGSHGMAAHDYGRMLDMIKGGRLQPGRLVGRRVSLEEAAEKFASEELMKGHGIAVVELS